MKRGSKIRYHGPLRLFALASVRVFNSHWKRFASFPRISHWMTIGGPVMEMTPSSARVCLSVAEAEEGRSTNYENVDFS
jgi:hypothetical protein